MPRYRTGWLWLSYGAKPSAGSRKRPDILFEHNLLMSVCKCIKLYMISIGKLTVGKGK